MKIAFYLEPKRNKIYTKFSFSKTDCDFIGITRMDMPKAKLNRSNNTVTINKVPCKQRRRTDTNIGFAAREMNTRFVDMLGVKESVSSFVVKHRINNGIVTIKVTDVLDALTRPSEQASLDLPKVKFGNAISASIGEPIALAKRRSITHAQVAAVAAELAIFCPEGEYAHAASDVTTALNCGVDPDQVETIRLSLYGEQTEADRLNSIITDLEQTIVKIKGFNLL